ncbi:MAG: hypothetical protein AB1489_21275 [Acidobacteriota bacterium]
MLSTLKSQRQYEDINFIEPIGSNDEECISELRAVLERHGRLQRFGICLLHTHFNMADDEILMETCDTTTRTLTISPVKKEHLKDEDIIITNWSLEQGNGIQACNKKDHISALQACSKKDHITYLKSA